MKLIVDAQLPRRLSLWLTGRGFDVVHTLDLPSANRTTDEQINELSVKERRVVVTKDTDFVDSYLLTGIPFKLLHISTGNISNNSLLSVFDAKILEIEEDFDSGAEFIEINSYAMIVHM